MKNIKSAAALLTLLLCGIFIFAGCNLDDTLNSYTVTVAANIQNGTITASPDRGSEGTTVSLTIAPDANYRLKAGSLTVTWDDGTPIDLNGSGNAFTFTLPAANVSVSGEFEPVQATTAYNITIATGIQNGTITTNAASAAAGSNITLTITPTTGFQFKDGTLTVKQTDGTVVAINSTGNTHTFIMPASDVTVNGEFEAVDTTTVYDVSIADTIQNGTITADPTSGISGTTITLTIVPTTGFQLKDGTLTVKRTDGTAATLSGTGNTRTFTIPPSNVTVSGEFEAVDTTTVYNVSIADTIQNGAITTDPKSGTDGTTITLTITPTTGFQLKDGTLTVKKTDGTAVTVSGTGNTRTFTMPASDVTVNGEFEAVVEPTNYNVTIADTIQNGAITTDPKSGTAGTTITLTITPNDGFQFKGSTLTVKRTDGTAVTVSGTGNTRTFTMPASDVTVDGEFEAVGTTKKITITGLNGKSGEVQIGLLSSISEESWVADGTGTISNGSVTISLLAENRDPWTGSGDCYLVMGFDGDGSYLYTGGKTFAELGIPVQWEDNDFIGKLPKYTITSTESTIAFDQFRSVIKPVYNPEGVWDITFGDGIDATITVTGEVFTLDAPGEDFDDTGRFIFFSEYNATIYNRSEKNIGTATLTSDTTMELELVEPSKFLGTFPGTKRDET